jgi:hypothetical protein
MSKKEPSMKSLSAAALTLCLFVACVHRPYYRELLAPPGAPPGAAPSEGQSVALRLVDPASGQPLPDVLVRFGEGRFRVVLKTNAQGELTLPVTAALLRENPLVEVVRTGPGGYAIAGGGWDPADAGR